MFVFWDEIPRPHQRLRKVLGAETVFRLFAYFFNAKIKRGHVESASKSNLLGLQANQFQQVSQTDLRQERRPPRTRETAGKQMKAAEEQRKARSWEARKQKSTSKSQLAGKSIAANREQPYSLPPVMELL